MWRSDAEGAPVADPLGIFPDVGAGQSGVVNGPGNTCGYVYDGLDRQIQVVCDLRVGGVGSGVIDTSNPTNPDGQIRLGYGFDGNSRLVRIVDDNGNVTSFGYDALDRQVSRTNADGEVFSTTYDRDSNVRTVTDPNGTVVTKSYDALNRLVATSVARGVGVGGTTAEAFAYDGLSRLTACSDDNGALAATQVCERVYDSLGRTLEERLNGLPVSTVWSGDSKRVACVYPGGRTVTNTFDAVDRVKSVSDQVGLLAESDWIGPGYRELERRLGNGTRRSWLDATGTVAEGYDSVKRVVRERVYLPGGGVLVDREYGYNRASVRTSEVRHDWGGQSDGYVYDSAYRIVQTNLDQAGVGSDPVRDVASIDYVLDGVGNRREVTKTDRGGVASTEAVSVNVMNEYEAVGATAYSHDDNGNRTSDGSRAYVWDYKNRLVGVLQQGSGIPVAVYRYHADNRRAEKQVYDSGGTLTRTTAYYYDGWQVCEERNGSGATEATYVWSPVYVDELISVERSAASPEGAGRFWAHQNVRYDVVAVTDAAGGVVERRRFDDFGNAEFVDAFGTVSTSSPGGFVYGFQGRRLDGETGFLYFRNRFYDPALGRFLQRDPVWDAGNVGGWYTFVGGGPASGTDPSGLMGEAAPRLPLPTPAPRVPLRVLPGGGGGGLPAVGGQSALTGTRWTASSGRFASSVGRFAGGTVRFIGRVSLVVGVAFAIWDVGSIIYHSATAISSKFGAYQQAGQAAAATQELARERGARGDPQGSDVNKIALEQNFERRLGRELHPMERQALFEALAQGIDPTTNLQELINVLNQATEALRQQIISVVSDHFAQYLENLRKLDPCATMGMRGSTATGTREGGAPWNPLDFDLDVWIKSDRISGTVTDKAIPTSRIRDYLAQNFPSLFQGLREGSKGVSVKVYPTSSDLGPGVVFSD